VHSIIAVGGRDVWTNFVFECQSKTLPINEGLNSAINRWNKEV